MPLLFAMYFFQEIEDFTASIIAGDHFQVDFCMKDCAVSNIFFVSARSKSSSACIAFRLSPPLGFSGSCLSDASNCFESRNAVSSLLYLIAVSTLVF